jgi:ribosomal protein S18 acetylase RimI-like enzyme
MTDTTCTFRLATPADVDTLERLISAFHLEDGHPIDAAVLRRALQAVASDEPLLRVWMITRDTFPIGYVALALGFSIEVGGLDAFLDELYVLPEHRRRGIGHQAVTFVERESARLGVRRLCLEVETRNDKARKLYESFDYADHSRHLMSKWL